MKMNKNTFLWVLQSALLSWDGVTEEELIKNYKINQYIARAGIRLKKYLQSVEVLEDFSE